MTGEYFQLWIMSISDPIFAISLAMEHIIMSTLLCFPDSAAFCIFLTGLHSCLPLPTGVFLCCPVFSRGAVWCTVYSLNMSRHMHVYQINNLQHPVGSEFLAVPSSIVWSPFMNLSSTRWLSIPLKIPLCWLNTSENGLENALQGSTDTQGYSGTQDPLQYVVYFSFSKAGN